MTAYLAIAAVLYLFAQALQMGTGAARLAGVRSKRVSFETDGPLDTSGLPVARVIAGGPRVELLTDEPEALLRALFARGSAIRNLEVAGASLEEAVVGLTAGGT